MNDNYYEKIVSSFEEIEKSWAFHDVNIGLVIKELFSDTINDEDSIFGISSSQIIQKCRKIHEWIMKSPKPFEEGIEITKKMFPESTKIIIWLHEHQG